MMAQFNGTPLEITYDTGAQGPVIAKSLADKLGLAVVGQAMIGSPEGGTPVPVKVVAIDSLTIAGFAASIQTAVVPDDVKMPPGSTLVIGNNEFPNARIEFDFANAKLRLGKSGIPSDANDTKDWIPLSEFGFTTGTIQIAGESIPLHIDSGNPGWLELPKSFAARLPLQGKLQVASAIRLVDKEIPRFSAPIDTVARIVQ